MPGVVETTKIEDFDKVLTDAKSDLVVVHFTAVWAPQCQQINDVLAELAKDTQYINTSFVKVEAESLPEVSQRYQIEAVPTCILIKNQKVVDRVNGANVPELTKKVEHHASLMSTVPFTSPPAKQDLETRLKELVNRAPVMLFMKGSPEEPKCGFSRTTVQLLKDQGVKYSTFNILADEEVRQGLKTYSNWPTYPQLYANGELVGGLDIIKELVESGEFLDQMPKQENLDDRLKTLLNKDRVMVFMKGNPDTPRCGFSKTTIQLLNSTGVKYSHFDILEDEDVRQGLKKYSDWPTYPQLYVNGELIGGLDIMKELQESGELESVLKEGQ